jgi:hypothetical protein
MDFQFDPSAPLGFVEDSGADPDKFGVAECGLALDVKRKASIIDIDASMRNLVFPATTRKIVWYARFGPKGMAQQQIPRKFKIEWYGPDGKLYHQVEFKSSFWMEDLVKQDLEFSAPLLPEMTGRWRVRVFCKGELLDDRYFEIVRANPA